MKRKKLSILDCLRQHTEEHPDKIAFTFFNPSQPDESICYRELEQRARSLAVRFREWAAPGERALLVYPASGVDFVTVFLACLYAKIIAVPTVPPRRNRLNQRFSAALKNSGAKLIFHAQAVSSSVLHDSVDSEIRIISAAEPISTEPAPHETSTDFGPEDIAFLQYTSGSTGLPKGVMVSHGNITHNTMLLQRAFAASSDSVIVNWMPLFHDMGLVGAMFLTLYTGCSAVLMSPATFSAQPIAWLQAISHYKGTISGAPNFGYDYCVKKVDPSEQEGLDLSSWAVAANGAEPIRYETLERFAGAFKPCGFEKRAFQCCYGMAEATLVMSATGKESEVNVISRLLDKGSSDKIPRTQRVISCGRPVKGVEIRIVQPRTASPVADGMEGEIWVSSGSVAQGYWNRPDETREIFQARLAHENSGDWLNTGDLGFIKNGELFVTGRHKDLLIFRGRNFYPQDLENLAERMLNSDRERVKPNGCAAVSVLIDNEARLVLVIEANRGFVRTVNAACKVKDDSAQQTSAKKKRDKTVTEIISRLRAPLAEEYDVSLYAVLFLRPGSFPRTSSGKVQRQACRSIFEEATDCAVYIWYEFHETVRETISFTGQNPESYIKNNFSELAAIRDGICEVVIDWLKKESLLIGDRIAYDASWATLGVDSMGIVAVGAEVQEKVDLILSPEILYEQDTVNKLSAYIYNQKTKIS